MSVAMLSKLENMLETYKALSAVLTAGLDESLQEKDISPKTRNFFAFMKAHKPAKEIDKEVASSLKVQKKEGQFLILISSKNAFVMIPADRRRPAIDESTLQHPEEAYKRLSVGEKSILAFIKSLDDSPDLNSSAETKGLCSLTGQDLLTGESRVIQAYLIAGPNIAAFCKAGESDNQAYFQPQFHADSRIQQSPILLRHAAGEALRDDFRTS